MKLVNEHSNKYYANANDDQVVDHRPGMIPSIKDSLAKMIEINPLIPPITLFVNLQGDSSIPKENLPLIKQIQGFKNRTSKKAYGNEEVTSTYKWCMNH